MNVMPTKRQLIIELWIIGLLCTIAIAVEVLALTSAFKPDSESLATWFQRSGAITCVFGTFAQFRTNNFLELIRGGTFLESWAMYKLFKKHQTVASWAVTGLAVWGAIVWGYGDLLIRLI